MGIGKGGDLPSRGGKEHRHWALTFWVQIPAYPWKGSVILGKLLNLSESQFLPM